MCGHIQGNIFLYFDRTDHESRTYRPRSSFPCILKKKTKKIVFNRNKYKVLSSNNIKSKNNKYHTSRISFCFDYREAQNKLLVSFPNIIITLSLWRFYFCFVLYHFNFLYYLTPNTILKCVLILWFYMLYSNCNECL